MKAVVFPEANRLIEGWTRPAVADIAAHVTVSQGKPVIVTCFEATDAEIAEIVRTRRVWVVVMGQAIPPMAITGESPFDDGPPVTAEDMKRAAEQWRRLADDHEAGGGEVVRPS